MAALFIVSVIIVLFVPVEPTTDAFFTGMAVALLAAKWFG